MFHTHLIHQQDCTLFVLPHLPHCPHVPHLRSYFFRFRCLFLSWYTLEYMMLVSSHAPCAFPPSSNWSVTLGPTILRECRPYLQWTSILPMVILVYHKRTSPPTSKTWRRTRWIASAGWLWQQGCFTAQEVISLLIPHKMGISSLEQSPNKTT